MQQIETAKCACDSANCGLDERVPDNIGVLRDECQTVPVLLGQWAHMQVCPREGETLSRPQSLALFACTRHVEEHCAGMTRGPCIPRLKSGAFWPVSVRTHGESVRAAVEALVMK
jgi:hypothetical protein